MIKGGVKVIPRQEALWIRSRARERDGEREGRGEREIS